jgi:hypothetical protein
LSCEGHELDVFSIFIFLIVEKSITISI